MKKLDHNVQLFFTRALFYFLIFLIAFSYLKRHFADWVLSSHHLPIIWAYTQSLSSKVLFLTSSSNYHHYLPRWDSLLTTAHAQLHSCYIVCFISGMLPIFFPAPLEHTPGAQSFKRPPSLTKESPENRSLLALFICLVHIVIFSRGGRGVGS